MKQIILALLLFNITLLNAQNISSPVYPNCETTSLEKQTACFNTQLKSDFLSAFNTPKNIDPTFKERIVTYFTVDKNGDYVINFMSTNSKDLKNEIKRVFKNLPKSKPAIKNGTGVESDFILPFLIPIDDNYNEEKALLEAQEKEYLAQQIKLNNKKHNPEINSGLTIPFTHQNYDVINEYYTSVENNHTAVKPYFYNRISTYNNVVAEKNKLLIDTDNIFKQKLFNDHLIKVVDSNYWFTINPVVDLEIGKDNSDLDYTFNNTRAINIQGGIGKLSFSTSYYESQGRFSNYINEYVKTLNPENGYAIMLGRGLSKKFKDDAFDYPVAEAYLTYTPNKHFNLQFGNGKNFIGDGYRSLLLSDVAAPYTFAKISTNFWKINYTNLWMWLDDVRTGSFENGSNLRKYVASHHLSINIGKRLNVGLFEATTTNKRSNDNIDINFINPLIFYRAVEFSRGSRSGNAIVGLNTKYKLSHTFNIYGQFVLDEIIVREFFKNNGYWANKFGVQIGAKYFHAFNIKDLTLQGELNVVRPFTYAHNDTELNYSHFYQPLAHPWGSNFAEFIGIARYRKDRWFGNAKFVVGKKGFDFTDNDISYGGDIFITSTNRESAYNNGFYQGNTAMVINADVQAGYLVNPSTNLQLFINISFRNFSALETIPHFSEENTVWFNIGLKTDLFNTYYDF
ncbi:MAG: gliding motility protein RemB [Flavobacteriaceae bacterium]